MNRYKGVQTLEILEGANNYNKWIVENFKQKIKGPILEVGAGTGNISKLLIQQCRDIYLSDIDASLIKHLCNNLSLSTKNIFLQDVEDAPEKKFLGFFKSIIAVNVLEHIHDDRLALKNLNRMLDNKGYLLLLVPAKKFAYTKLDKKIGHYRRYEKDELIEKCEQAGFIIEKVYFFNFVGIFSWIIRNQFDEGHIKSYQIKFFDIFVPLLKKIERVGKPPIGISLIIIAKKVSI